MSKNTAVFDETGVEQVVVYKWCPLTDTDTDTDTDTIYYTNINNSTDTNTKTILI